MKTKLLWALPGALLLSLFWGGMQGLHADEFY